MQRRDAPLDVGLDVGGIVKVADFVRHGLELVPKVIDKLNKEINAVVADPKIKTRLVELAFVPGKIPAPSSSVTSE